VIVLAVLTVIYNLAEGVVATYFGIQQATLTLFGFGADSLVETISAFGVAQMVFRIRREPHSNPETFETRALEITGWCFYILSFVLLISAISNSVEGHQPLSTLAGLIITLISIVAVWALVFARLRLGKKLGSAPVIAYASCNLVCVYMSVVLLVSSALWWIFEISYADIAGSLALVYFSVKKGKEAFEKAKGIRENCCQERN
jgi:hypothetical protein